MPRNGSTRRRERQLADVDRENFARREAIELQYRFVRDRWRPLAGTVAIAALFTPVAFFFPPFQRGMLLGGYIAAVAGVVTHWVIVASGSATRMMGDQGERWTRDAVRPLRKRNWRLVHNALFNDGADVDTLAIGPGGLVVVETKWSGSDWSEKFNQRVIAGAVASVTDHARRVGIFLRSPEGPRTVRSVVALWPATSQFEQRRVGETVVMSGHELAPWFDGLSQDVLTADEVAACWARVEHQVGIRDNHEYLVRGPRRRTPSEYFLELNAMLGGALSGMFLVAVIAGHVRLPLAPVAAIALCAGFFFARRWKFGRAAAQGGFLGASVTTAVLTAAVVAVAIWG